MKYGVDYSPLTGTIRVGRVNKAGDSFLDHEDKTQEFIRAAIDMWGGYETDITQRETGKRYRITIKEIS
jgi:hypothetical protein